MDKGSDEYAVIIQHRAECDIVEAFSYIFEHAPEAALRWYYGTRRRSTACLKCQAGAQ